VADDKPLALIEVLYIITCTVILYRTA